MGKLVAVAGMLALAGPPALVARMLATGQRRRDPSPSEPALAANATDPATTPAMTSASVSPSAPQRGHLDRIVGLCVDSVARDRSRVQDADSTVASSSSGGDQNALTSSGTP